MGLFDILIGVAILNDISKKHEKKSSDSIFGGSTYNRGYSDGYDDAWHDRELTMNVIVDIVRSTTRMVGKVSL